MILKIEVLVDANDELDGHSAQIIANLIDQVFKDNSHLAKLIICDVEVQEEKKHRWVFYMNGTYCGDCNEPIGTDKPCR